MTTKVGFIGLGNMGSAIAQRVLNASYELRVWNRSPNKADALVAAGAIRAKNVEEVFAESDIVFSMLSNDQAVETTFTDALLTEASSKIHVNMATVSLKQTRTLASLHNTHNVGYVAAPVLGRPDVAAAGQLNIVAAGPSALVDQARPILEHIGKQTWHVGEDPEQASLVKIGVNYNLIHAMQALGESLSLVEHGGIDSETFVDILTDAAFTGSAYVGYGKIIAQRSYKPAAFPVPLGLKDLTLVQQAAEELGAVLPTAPVMRDMYSEAINDPDLVDGDWSIIAEVIRRGPKFIG
ncbi:MAG: NAD(P)-dependent oxidoreductase [Gulosibacter sp.]|uniref:NAD(P)-dependent oxidoreductase n=1 Tax=Gulosibacter sp. TaxID=2817531 RepID=UPI003F8FADBB